jgi:hypothetical protein
LYKWYGIRECSNFDEKLYNNFISSFDTTQISFFSVVSDAEQFKEIINLATDSIQQKQFYQPIQIIYFQNDNIISYHINCNAGGKLRKLNWNINNRFNFFPPNTAVDIQNSNLSLTQLQKVYTDIKQDKPYNILVFWTLMMENISKDAIHTVCKNIHNFNMQDSTNIYLINTDKFYITVR